MVPERTVKKNKIKHDQFLAELWKNSIFQFNIKYSKELVGLKLQSWEMEFTDILSF